MRADSRPTIRNHHPLRQPLLPMPGPVQEAAGLLTRGRSGEAVAHLDSWLQDQDTASRRDPRSQQTPGRDWAVWLTARGLLDLKRVDACRELRDKALLRGWVAPRDAGLVILELHLALQDEDHVAVRNGAMALLEDLANQADPRHAEARLLLGASLRWLGDTSGALQHVEFAHAAFTVLDDPARAAVAANFLGWTHLASGRLEEARRWFEKSLAGHEELGHKLRMAQTYQNLAIVCYKQGDYAVALELLEREQKLVPTHPDMDCRARIARGNIMRLQGHFDEARRHLLEAYSLATESKLVREQVLTLEFLGDVLRDQGNPSEARVYYRRGLGLARSLAPRGDLVMELLRRQGECLDLEGEHIEANAVLTEALAIGNAVSDLFELGAIRRCLGLNAAHLGRWQLGCDHLEASLQILGDMRARHEALLSAEALARTLLRRIDAGPAGAAADRHLDAAWRTALRARQWQQELGLEATGSDLAALVEEISRRRLRDEAGPDWHLASGCSLRQAPRVVAVTSAFRDVLRRCDGFSRYKNPVLLEGESGTGKVLLARRIHEISPRGSAPLVCVVCEAERGDAMARELFGAAAGTASGTPGRQRGLIEEAEGGALLLQDIQNLPRDLQGRLLRFIQEGVYRPVGEGHERMANVRVLATCETDLTTRADKGQFRQDLCFRLKQMHVRIPALRERPEAILPLLDHFLMRLGEPRLCAREVLDAPGLEALTGHAWPGNAIELQAVAQQIWLNRRQGRPFRLRLRPHADSKILEMIEGGAGRADSGHDHPSGMTWNTLNGLISRAGGNKASVARNLGISRMTLYRWLEQLDPE